MPDYEAAVGKSIKGKKIGIPKEYRIDGMPAETRDMLAHMAPGSLIVDIAAERGGNCELTRPGETVVSGGVTIMGPLNLPSTIPYHASQMYAKNIATFLKYLIKDGKLALNREDEIVRETLVTHGGEVVHPKVREMLGLPAAV